MKKTSWLTKAILILAIGSGTVWVLGPISFSEPVAFQSLESVTETGAPVYNRVKFIPGSCCLAKSIS